MPATVTLATTTLAEGVDDHTNRVKLTATAGVLSGLRLYLDGELATVLRLDVDPWVIVTRGVDGSNAMSHAAGATVYIGRADQFYASPPEGRPPAAVLVSPYIDIVAGKVYFAQGDASPTASAPRWWQQQTAVYSVGALGVRTTTLDPTSST